jgi:hypothetical protein
LRGNGSSDLKRDNDTIALEAKSAPTKFMGRVPAATIVPIQAECMIKDSRDELNP